ncbi:GD19674 [Drosophila simulans]|uniref:GD19674 n=1 Tax=Drosophila simulans TaxID=7240 RepID=B4QVI9_DROSI|nr:GD19674 [Drosophila simulans]
MQAAAEPSRVNNSVQAPRAPYGGDYEPNLIERPQRRSRGPEEQREHRCWLSTKPGRHSAKSQVNRPVRPPHLADAVPPGEANAESVPLTHTANYEHHSPVATAANFTLAEAMAATIKRHIFVNAY